MFKRAQIPILVTTHLLCIILGYCIANIHPVSGETASTEHAAGIASESIEETGNSIITEEITQPAEENTSEIPSETLPAYAQPTQTKPTETQSPSTEPDSEEVPDIGPNGTPIL